MWEESGRDLDQDFSLLEYAIMEGLADFVAHQATGILNPPEQEREDYGHAYEAELWQEFSAEMDTTELGSWMYGPGKEGRPSDMGYWVGKQIVSAYYENMEDKTRALQDLMLQHDARELLRLS